MAATLIILVAAIVAFVSGRVPLGVVAVGVALALWATGVLELHEALAGFGDPTVLFIASLFVVSEALEATGVTAWAGSQVIRRAGTTRTAILVAVCLLVAGLTAFISVNGAVAASPGACASRCGRCSGTSPSSRCSPRRPAPRCGTPRRATSSARRRSWRA